MLRFTPPTRTYQGYIFDCDGTLADTMPLHFQAWQQALRAGGARFHFSWQTFNKRAGMSMEQTIVELGEEFGEVLDQHAIAEAQRRIYRSLRADTQPVHEVCAFAREVAQFAPVAVASGSIRPDVEQSLELIGMRDLFPVIVTPEDVEHGKPAPDLFLLAASKMGVPPENCLVLEDAEFGFLAAERAKMDVARVLVPEPDSLIS